MLLAPVSYTPLTEEEVFRHFLAVASATDLPLCIYSNPGTTNFTFSPDLVARLTAIPSIAAIKLPLPANGSIASDLAAFRAAAPTCPSATAAIGVARRRCWRGPIAGTAWRADCFQNRPPP